MIRKQAVPELNSYQLKRLPMTRVVSTIDALNAADFDTALSFRVAPDEVYVQADIDALAINDEHAIITKESSLSGTWLSMDVALHFLQHECAWELPLERPAFVQGMVAHLPVKLYFEESRVLIMTAAPFAHNLQERLKEFAS